MGPTKNQNKFTLTESGFLKKNNRQDKISPFNDLFQLFAELLAFELIKKLSDFLFIKETE
jgi:hypothetical protein